jgi:hypothetical protein
MGADGSGVTRLTDGTGGSRDPTWSADGTKIAFARGYQYDSQPSIAGIWVMNADGSGQTNLTSAVLPIDGEVTSAQLDAPDWSPDGTKIAFERSFKVLGDILVINADGTGLVSYGRSDPNSWVTLGSPAWSPDGEKIAYTYRTDCLEPEQCVEYFSDIWVMDTDGTNRTNLTNTPDDWESIPDWQPLPLAHDFGGFFAPVNNPPTLNVVKAGRAVPVKFSLGGDKGLDVFAEGYPRSRRISCSSSAPLDAIEQRTSAAGGSGLSYDAATERYTYVWKIQKAWSGTCRQLVVRLDDGSFHRANFRFK